MPRHHRRSDVEHLEAVSALVDAAQRDGQLDIDAVVHDINEANVVFVPGARFAGITVLDGAGTVATIGATDRYARYLDDVQRQVAEGPCLSAAWDRHTILIDDVAAEERWPRFCRTALTDTPVRSILSFRLFQDGDHVAALNFHAATAGVFDEASISAGLVAAAHTTMGWNILNREEKFKRALAGRDVIGRAKGIIMERFNIDTVGAFELLKRLSQEHNIRIAVIAERLVRRDHGRD